MRISKCKECDLHIYETLADGSKEHYCYPPIMPGLIAFAVPCKKRNSKCCKRILEEVKKMGSGFGNSTKNKRKQETIIRELSENGFELKGHNLIDVCCGRKTFVAIYENEAEKIIQVNGKDIEVKSVEKFLSYFRSELKDRVITRYNLKEPLMTDEFAVHVNEKGEIKECYVYSDRMALVEL